jgi:natural product precursor
MKQLKKISLRGVSELLTEREMKSVVGGANANNTSETTLADFGIIMSSYRCCCGMGNNSACQSFLAPNLDAAMNVIMAVCGDRPSGCFME